MMNIGQIIGFGSIIAFLITACQSEETPSPFELHPDFKLQLIAQEPQIFDPVGIVFDERGELFALEMPGYPLHDAESKIVHLIDRNKDGVYEQRKVYADSLGVASSFMCYRNGFLVAAPPYLLYLEDTNQDDVADQRTVVMEGFEVGNLQHNFNGLQYGLDNWIYAANGGNSGNPFFPDDEKNKKNLRGNDFRIKPDLKQFELYAKSSGGFGLAMDANGQFYGTHNTQHISQLIGERRYLDKLPLSLINTLSNISDHETDGLARIYSIGEQVNRVNHPEQSGFFSGACGISFYGGGLFPEEFRDNIFVADVVLNLIHRDVLSPEGSIMSAGRGREKVEFLASTDRSFRPVNTCTGPDGALYIIDMHRDVIEHPEWIPDELESKMDLHAGKEKGRIYKISPKNQEAVLPNLQFDQPDFVIQSFSHPNQWMRMTAQRMIVEDKVELTSLQLKQLLLDTNAVTRLHAMWALEEKGLIEEKDLSKLLFDEHFATRKNALIVGEKFLIQDAKMRNQFLEVILEDANSMVRRQGLLSLGSVIDLFPPVEQARIRNSLVESFLIDEADEWTQIAYLTIFAGAPQGFSNQILSGEIPIEQKTFVYNLGLIDGKVLDPEIFGETIKNTLSGSLSNELKVQMLKGLAQGIRQREEHFTRNDKRLLTGVFRNMNDYSDLDLIEALLHIQKNLNIQIDRQKLFNQAITNVENKDLPTSERLAYLRILGFAPLGEVKDLLFQIMLPKAEASLQRSAAEILTDQPNESTAEYIVANWTTFKPELKKILGNYLLYQRSLHPILLSALESKAIQLGEMNFDLERRRVLLFSQNEKIKQRAERLFSDAGVVTRSTAIEQMQPALKIKGDISRGKEQFILYCASCHQKGDVGEPVGPNLTEIYRKSSETLLHDILDPNAAVDPEYLSYTAYSESGKIVNGIIVNQNQSQIEMMQQGGLKNVIETNSLERLESSGLSLMPEEMEKTMTHQNMADLLAFLQQVE